MAKTITREACGEAYKELARGTATLDQISISSNFRKTFNQDRLRELAENIKQVGVLEPILTRVNPEPTASAGPDMILVAGARRLEATRLAGITEIPYRLLDLTEEQANEVQALENLHREQLNPIEEAQAFKTLLDQGSYTVEDLAGRVNKSAQYVYRAVKLLDLPENAQLHIACGDFTPSHGHRLLLLTPEQQSEVVEWMENETAGGEPWPTVAAMASHIEMDYGRTLDGAVFPTDTEYAGKPACTSCPHNAAAQSMLFDAQAEGQCLDGKCFAEKVQVFDEELGRKAYDTYKGMSFLGVEKPVWKGWAGNYTTRIYKFGKKGHFIEEMDKNPIIKAAIKKAPQKLGFGVNSDTHQVVLVVTDKDLWAELTPAKKDEQPKETPEQVLARQKKEFIEGQVQLRAGLKFVTDKKPVDVKTTARLVDTTGMDDDGIWPQVAKALGVKELNDRSIQKLSKDTLIRLALLKNNTTWRGTPIGDFIKTSGVNLKEISKAHAAEIAQAWEQELERKRENEAAIEKAKAAKKARKQEPEEEEQGEDTGEDE